PASLKPGVQANVPAVLDPFGANVAPLGRLAAVSEVIASPSGSAAVTVKVSAPFSAAERLAGAVTTGGWSTVVTVDDVAALPLRAIWAVNVTAYGPGAASKPGVQANVPAVLVPFGVNVAPLGRFAAVSEAIGWPSGSEAVTVNESAAFSATVCEEGAVTTGARSGATVIEVDAVPDSAFCAANVTT